LGLELGDIGIGDAERLESLGDSGAIAAMVEGISKYYTHTKASRETERERVC
jgi:hypothetical protein